MARKNTGPIPVRCIDCVKEEPVVGEFPAWDGTAIFCRCKHLRHYRQRRWAQPCSNFKPKNDEKSLQ